MEFDFALEWQNIEYALNESEFVTLSEISTGPVTGNLGRNMKIAGKVAYTGFGAPLAAVNVAARAGGKVGMAATRGAVKLAKGVAKSRFGKMEFWGRLVQRLKEIWQRFKNIISALFKSNDEFIAKELYNAEAVLRNALSDKRMSGKDFNFDNIYPYWNTFNTLMNIRIPQLNIGNGYMMESLDDKNNFVNANIPTLRNLDFNSPNCVEQLKQSLRGSAEPIAIGIEEVSKNARQMVDFVRTHKQIISQLEAEQNTIIKSAQEALRMVTSVEQGGEDNAMANSYDMTRADKITKDAMRIRNFISLAQNILGVKQTICHEYATQSLSVMKLALRKCKAVLSGEIENTRMRHYISPDQLEDQEVKNYGGTDSKLGKFVSGVAARTDAARQLNPKEKKSFSVDNSYYDTLSNSKVDLEKEAQKIKAEKQRLVNFIRGKRMRADDPRFIEIKRVIDDYDKRLALLGRKAMMIDQQAAEQQAAGEEQ